MDAVSEANVGLKGGTVTRNRTAFPTPFSWVTSMRPKGLEGAEGY